MLTYCDRPIDEPIGLVAPRYGAATPLRLAANAVMAGCRPEHLPVVTLAIAALCEEKFNLYGVNATTHPCSTLIIVNGPVAKELRMLSEENIERRIRQWPVFKGEFVEAGPDRLVPVMKSPDNAVVIVLGGAGKHSAYIPTFGATHPVTKPLKRRNGEFARSVQEFRQN